jgi:hypothetical protein
MNKDIFNPLDVFQNEGELELMCQLTTKSDHELRQIVRFQAWLKGKELREASRVKLIYVIAEGTKEALHKGLGLALIKSVSHP